MAITKIHPIKSTLKKALDYICDPKKTEEKLLISSFGCSPETADIEFDFTRKLAKNKSEVVLARHIIQSFEPGEVTPEKAHELGKQFADEVLGGKYEYVLSTHIDKGHVHNHIIFNNVNLLEHTRYDSNKKSYHLLRRISDRICKENGLSVIENPVAKNISRAEYEKGKENKSWKAQLRKDIDSNIGKSKSFDSFLSLMKKDGYEIKQGKHIAFRAQGQERFARAKTLGELYTEEAIIKRIKEQGRSKRNFVYQPNILKINLLLKVKAHLAAQSRSNSRRGKVYDLREAANTLNFLVTQNVTTYANLEERMNVIEEEFIKTGSIIKETEIKMRKMSATISDLTKYQAMKPVNDAYKKAINKSKFRDLHESELIIFEAAERELKRNSVDENTNVAKLRAKFAELEERKSQLYQTYQKTRGKLHNFKNAKENIRSILSAPRRQAEKQKDIKKEIR